MTPTATDRMSSNPAKEIRVLVADDSSFAREMIISLFSPASGISLAGEAANGLEAVRMVKELHPDLVVMDIEMPVMNGLEAIELIMEHTPVPILVVTARGDAATAFAALAKGALEVVEKPDMDLLGDSNLVRKIKLLAGVKVITHIKGASSLRQLPVLPAFNGGESDGIVAIAASTGGPQAISIILSGLPVSFPLPVVIAQHMAEGFTGGMVKWLKQNCKLEVTMAANGATINPGKVFIAPSEYHMKIGRRGAILLVERQSHDIFRPSCDVLLESVAKIYGARSIGIILTGMGSDGVAGIQAIKRSGGITIAQDEKSSVIFGMPKVAIDSGCIDRVVAVDKIAEVLSSLSGAEYVAGY